MKLILFFAILLHVWTALCVKCRTNNGEIGVCKMDCNTVSASQNLTRCGRTAFYCCAQGTSTFASTLDESKFPTDCGYFPFYAQTQTVHEVNIRPDQYSWLASLQYGNHSSHGICSGSVINSRYVLTAAHCVTGASIRDIGGLTGVRLGAYNELGRICDYGIESCKHYQEFGIENIVVHSEFTVSASRVANDIALIRLDRPIQFGAKLQPICLPFGNNYIREQPEEAPLIATGWGNPMDINYIAAKRAAIVIAWKTDNCKELQRGDGKLICAVGPDDRCRGDGGDSLMHQFAHQRMVLEGIAAFGNRQCQTDVADVYTRVRSYGDWLKEKIET